MVDYDSLRVGTHYLYEGARVRLLGKHESLNLGTEKIEVYLTIRRNGGQRQRCYPTTYRRRQTMTETYDRFGASVARRTSPQGPGTP